MWKVSDDKLIVEFTEAMRGVGHVLPENINGNMSKEEVNGISKDTKCN